MTYDLTTVAIDAHVHLYSQTPLLEALSAAAANLASACESKAGVGMLMLTESHGHDAFSRLAAHADQQEGGLRRCREPEVLEMSVEGWRLWIVAGRQVVSQEKVEVLTLGALTQIADGKPLDQVLATAKHMNAVVVLPWGVGKWLGARRAKINQAIEQTSGDRLHLGDIAGRPALWRDRLLSRNSRGLRCVLSGTDPYPLPDAWRRIGSFGSLLRFELNHDQPLESLKTALAKTSTATVPFGARVTTSRFIREQVALRGNHRETS